MLRTTFAVAKSLTTLHQSRMVIAGFAKKTEYPAVYMKTGFATMDILLGAKDNTGSNILLRVNDNVGPNIPPGVKDNTGPNFLLVNQGGLLHLSGSIYLVKGHAKRSTSRGKSQSNDKKSSKKAPKSKDRKKSAGRKKK